MLLLLQLALALACCLIALPEASEIDQTIALQMMLSDFLETGIVPPNVTETNPTDGAAPSITDAKGLSQLIRGEDPIADTQRTSSEDLRDGQRFDTIRPMKQQSESVKREKSGKDQIDNGSRQKTNDDTLSDHLNESDTIKKQVKIMQMRKKHDPRPYNYGNSNVTGQSLSRHSKQTESDPDRKRSALEDGNNPDVVSTKRSEIETSLVMGPVQVISPMDAPSKPTMDTIPTKTQNGLKTILNTETKAHTIIKRAGKLREKQCCIKESYRLCQVDPASSMRRRLLKESTSKQQTVETTRCKQRLLRMERTTADCKTA